MNKKRFVIWISCFSFLIGLTYPSKKGVLLGIPFFILFINIIKNRTLWDIKLKNQKYRLNCLVSFIFINVIYLYIILNNWRSSPLVNNILSSLHLPINLTIWLVSLALLLLSSVFVAKLSQYLVNKTAGKEENRRIEEKIDLKLVLFILVISIIMITICSRTSPLYTFNDSFDSHIYFTIGRGMKEKVLYRDLVDQKGPFIYFIHYLGALISERSFFGVYLIQILFSFLFLYYVVKTVKIFTKKNSAIYIGLPIFSAIVYSSFCYWYGNNSEEYCWPSLIFGIYILCKSYHYSKPISNKEFFWIGVTSGFVLWLKFTFLGFYLGWYIIPLLGFISASKWKELIESVLFILLGVITISIPVLLYFLVNNSLYNLWDSYFYNNLFLYSSLSLTNENSNFVFHYIKSLIEQAQLNKLLTLTMLLNLLWLFNLKNRKLMCSILCSFLVLSLVVLGIGVTYLYYYSIFAVFGVFSIVYFSELLDLFRLKKLYLVILSILISSFIVIDNSRNIAFINKNADEYPQIKFAKIINTTPNATLLNYDMLDAGFYTSTGIIPNAKYFCRINMPIQEQFDEQNYLVDHGEVDYIVTKEFHEFQKYSLISEADYDNGEGNIHYYLYQLK